jgi:hypothetical protein
VDEDISELPWIVEDLAGTLRLAGIAEQLVICVHGSGSYADR